MDLIVSIENDTDLTPELKNVQLEDAHWMDGQALKDGQSIANHKRVVGWVEGEPPFKGTVDVHYGFLPPGPGSADVTISFAVDADKGISYGDTQAPNNAFPNTDMTIADEDGHKYLLTTISS